LTITTLFGCDFCSTQRSAEALAQGLDDEEIASCALPDYDPGDERVAVALEYARALVADVMAGYDDWDALYEKLRAHFSEAELAELICLCANTIGGTLVARTLNLPTGVEAHAAS
jgi:alkylhydroperoxidase family enzyme